MSFCLSPLREESLPFLTAPGLTDMGALLIFSQFLWALSFPVKVPQAGKPDVGPGPLLLRGTSAVVISLLFVGCPTGVGRGALVLTRPGLYASYLSQCGLFLTSLVVENLLC